MISLIQKKIQITNSYLSVSVLMCNKSGVLQTTRLYYTYICMHPSPSFQQSLYITESTDPSPFHQLTWS